MWSLARLLVAWLHVARLLAARLLGSKSAESKTAESKTASRSRLVDSPLLAFPGSDAAGLFAGSLGLARLLVAWLHAARLLAGGDCPLQMDAAPSVVGG